MNKIFTRLIAAGVTSAGAIAGAYLLAPSEGESLTAFPDHLAGGVVTGCYGQTGKGFRVGQQFTAEECIGYLAADLIVREAALGRMLKRKPTDGEWAAFLNHGYQFGLRAFETSTMLKKFNAGDRVGACREFTEAKNSQGEKQGWVYTGGKNCRVRANKCYGMVTRAERNQRVCLGEELL